MSGKIEGLLSSINALKTILTTLPEGSSRQQIQLILQQMEPTVRPREVDPDQTVTLGRRLNLEGRGGRIK